MKTSQGEIYRRREKILVNLKEKEEILVKDLAEQLNVSEITIRRDLQKFDEEGIIEKFYGGARLNDQLRMEEKAHTIEEISGTGINNLPVKKSLAQKGAEFVREGDVVFLNSGSTAFHLFDFINQIKLTVITNNGHILDSGTKSKAEVVVSGGEVYGPKKSLVGDFAIYTFSKIAANICFLGVGGINENCISTFALAETAVNRTILERTNGPRIVLAEGYKVGKENNFVTSDIALVTHLITDRTANREAVRLIEQKGVKVIIIDEEGVNEY